jgi:hypothetical protein
VIERGIVILGTTNRYERKEYADNPAKKEQIIVAR